MTLTRPDHDALATIWDGNKYVQCRLTADRTLRCEAAGALMQPSLNRVLGPDRISRLAALGWHLDTSFGNYTHVFPGGLLPGRVAEGILQALAEGYDADLTNLDVRTDWIASEECPPRNGPSQNLAGMIDDAPAMRASGVHACAYLPGPDRDPPSPLESAAELKTLYGTTVIGEVQRLKVNIDRRVYFALDTGAGYVQCRAHPQQVYCEAQSADSWPVLSRVLTAERVARLHAAGYADPGRGPNYWKNYPVDKSGDAVIADELLAILHDVYGYDGVPKLKVVTEKGRY